MKVGTDGVLLGCWAPTSHLASDIGHRRILDVGTGSGLIALMLQQRCPDAHIDAIDIDPAAVAQARANGANASLSRLQEWKPGVRYGLVVSNPPYFKNSLKNPDKGRELARHTDTLSYEELVAHASRLMAEEGVFALILPAEAEEEIMALAAKYNLTPTRITRVYSKESKPARRIMMAFSRRAGISEYRHTETDSLVLENETGGRSAAYQELCKEFYL